MSANDPVTDAIHDGFTSRSDLTIATGEEGAALREQRLAVAVDYMTQGLCLFSADKRVVISNKRYAQIYGLCEADVAPGTALEDILSKRVAMGIFAGESSEDYVNQRLQKVEKADTEIIDLNNGRSILVVRKPFENGYWVTTHEDITERRRAEARAIYLASHDMLTDLPNRAMLQERLDCALARVQRGEKIALLWLDMDDFKAVNDTYGHGVGDQLLRKVAQRMKNNVRQSDTVARIGGDEFAILQTQINEPEDAARLAQRLLDRICGTYLIDGQQISVCISIGIVVADKDMTEPSQLQRSADLALYRAKNEGGKSYCFFDTALDTKMQIRRQMEMELREAITRGEFELHYQPIINLKERRITCFEALLRWNHPVRGLVPPNDFIPIAEASGLIVQIGTWVLQQACSDAMNWPDEIGVAVNLSARQFRSVGPLGDVVNALDQSGLAPARLELEITESLLLDNADQAVKMLCDLKALGVRISMDDFGTGYSSLSYLSSFPFDKIKIDRSFIKDLPNSDRALMVLRSMAGLGRNLGMVTTAEGIETEDQLDIAGNEGCTEVQGFFLGRPVRFDQTSNVIVQFEQGNRLQAASA